MTVSQTPNGHGNPNFGVGGFGVSGLDIVVDFEASLGLSDVHSIIRQKAPSKVIFKRAKIKNIGREQIILNRLANIPKALETSEPIIIILRSGQVAEIALDAYDPEQIKVLRNSLRLLVDPASGG